MTYNSTVGVAPAGSGVAAPGAPGGGDSAPASDSAAWEITMGLRHRLIEQLAERSPRSTAELAEALGIGADRLRELAAPTARWGVELDSAGERWALPRRVELLRPELIRAELGAGDAARLSGLEILGEVDSTNAYLMRRRGEGLDPGHACFAEGQTEGRGRRANPWISPFGANIYLSVLWVIPAAAESLAGLSLVAGLAAVRALEGMGVSGVGLKWPNDLVWRDRKLGGVLVEVVGGSGRPWTAVVGTGLNLSMPDRFGAAIGQPWVDLESIADAGIGRNRLAGSLLRQLLTVLDDFTRRGFGPYREEWTAHHAWQGQEVTVGTENGTHAGVAEGIDETGALLLRVDGRLERHLAGDVSLRRRG